MAPIVGKGAKIFCPVCRRHVLDVWDSLALASTVGAEAPADVKIVCARGHWTTVRD